MRIHGINNWREVANHVEGKYSLDCRQRYYQINPTVKREKWTEEEDIRLDIGVKVYGPGNWAQICEIFDGTRTDIQCRERYCNILDP